jgi:trk system potassium uptake protein
MGITIFSGIFFTLCIKGEKVENLTKRESMAIVTFGWTSAGLFGALPFYIGGEFGSFVNAFFESVSGFTTTGSSVLTNIEGVSQGFCSGEVLSSGLGVWESLCCPSQFFHF